MGNLSVWFYAFIWQARCICVCDVFYNAMQNNKDVKVTATCIRVPVMRAHAESVNLQFDTPLDEV